MRKTLLLLSLFVLSAFGQQRLPGEVPTPQASSLGRYGDVPVSLYTGTVSVSIPIFSTEVRGVVLNASIDYDGAGIRMNSLPGPMGYGWMLNCGGVITRSLNGKYDEHIPNGINNPSNYFHCYDTIEELMASPENDYQLLKSASLSLYDMQPDVFYFNFMGMTGRFFLGNDGEWKVLSEHNIDVEHQIYGDEYFGYPLFTYSPGWQTSSTQPKVIKMFRLRDDKGNIYEFGNGNAIYGAIDLLSGFSDHHLIHTGPLPRRPPRLHHL